MQKRCTYPGCRCTYQCSFLDMVFIRDTVLVVQQKVEMASPHIRHDIVIDNDTLRVDIRLSVTLQQTNKVEYK